MKRGGRFLAVTAAVLLAVPLLLAAVSQFTAVISLPDIATMRSLGAASQFYPNIIVTQYNTSTGYGGDVFRWDPTSTASADSCTVFTASGVSTGRWVRQLYGKPISVEDCGAYNDGTHASATLTAFQAANDYAAASGVPTQPILALGAHYDFGSAATGVVKASSFYCPQWTGGGSATAGASTLITMTPAAEGAIFTFVGTSGASDCGGGVKGFVFEGNANTVGVESDGQCGMRIDVSAVVQMELVVLLHNKSSGQFTENNLINVNTNGSLFGTVLEYRVTAGDPSFHGSGIIGGFINYGAGGAPAILIGAGALPYNAPINGATFFSVGTSGAAVIIRNNSATASGEPWFVGSIRAEDGTASSISFGAGNDFMLVGGASAQGANSKFHNGTMYLASYVGTLVSGQRVSVLSPIPFVGTTTGAVTNILWPSNAKYNNYIVNIQVQGAGYNGFYRAEISWDEGTSGFNITNPVATTPVNTAGYGDVALQLNSGSNNIGITSTATPFVAGLSYAMTMTQTGQGLNHHTQN